MYALRETEFLRLKRTRIGREDFESLKVIGRGAFGEVCYRLLMSVDFSGLELNCLLLHLQEKSLFVFANGKYVID